MRIHTWFEEDPAQNHPEYPHLHNITQNWPWLQEPAMETSFKKCWHVSTSFNQYQSMPVKIKWNQSEHGSAWISMVGSEQFSSEQAKISPTWANIGRHFIGTGRHSMLRVLPGRHTNGMLRVVPSTCQHQHVDQIQSVLMAQHSTKKSKQWGINKDSKSQTSQPLVRLARLTFLQGVKSHNNL